MLTRTRFPYVFLVALLALTTHFASAQVGVTVPKSYVSLSINNRNIPWPNVPFGNLRLWDSGVRWNQMNTSRGYINWSALDAWVNLAQSKGIDLIYTFGGTPVWASTNKYQTGCVYGNGTCAPPYYADWEEFVGQVVSRYKGRIKYYELWNEPNHNHYWVGSMSQMVELSRRAANLIRGIDPNARILSPSPTWAATTAWDWMNSYLNAGGGNYFDIVAFHAYTGNQKAETTFYIIDGLKRVMANHGISSRSMFMTEGGWGRNTVMPDSNMQAGFLAQRLLLTWSRGVSRYYWYQWDNLYWGTLWTSSGGTNQAGIALGQIYKWLVGNKLSSLCSQNSTTYTWQCPITRADGVKTIAVWNATGSKSFPVPSGFTKYQDLAGVTRSINGSSVTIGWKPILLVGGTTTSGGTSDAITCDYSGMAQPSVKICSPTGTSSTSVHVLALAADSKAVNSMKVYIDGVLRYTKDSAAKVDTYVTVSSGSHTVRVTATNSAGTTYSDSSTITAN